ncbi:MAG TPA: Ig-like domain-containing protein [Haliangiales bacterium]|nr:Ig-like domain-containing protein [Haliangiales bacterium]
MKIFSFVNGSAWFAALLVATSYARAATNFVAFGGASLTFRPSSLTINVGDTVVWTNAGGIHTVTGDGADPICGDGTVATSCSHTFNSAGTFGYHCIPHVGFGMVGSVTVQALANIAPSVTITNPVSGAVFAAPADVTLLASASDTDGNVTNVQFFANSTAVGSAAASPFSVVAGNLAAGNYALTAVATDNGGLSATSSPVNISVVTPMDVMLSLPSITNGEFQFTYAANAGLRYVIEHSSNFVNWNAVVTNTASSSNEKFGEVFDVNLLRFYRVGRLPNP